MDYKQAVAVAHTLSDPSKMPGYGYSIPARNCLVGSRLMHVVNSVCSKCYAKKGRYVFRKVKDAMEKRYNTLSNPLWVNALAFMINYHASPNRKAPMLYFRWHDSGDLQGAWHLEKIAGVCERTPTVKHWLPTREIAIVRKYLEDGNVLPLNLTVRLSSPMIGLKIKGLSGLPVATVGYNGPDVVQCEAYQRGGKCGPCRACWGASNVNYPQH